MNRSRALKSKAHALKPVVRVGHKGLTPPVVEEINIALEHHTLIKIKLLAERTQRKSLAENIAEQCNAELIQMIGQVAVFYREKAE